MLRKGTPWIALERKEEGECMLTVIILPVVLYPTVPIFVLLVKNFFAKNTFLMLHRDSVGVHTLLLQNSVTYCKDKRIGPDMKPWIFWVVDSIPRNCRWKLESTYPWFQNYNVRYPWIIFWLFHYMDWEADETCLWGDCERGGSKERHRYKMEKEADGIQAHCSNSFNDI